MKIGQKVLLKIKKQPEQMYTIVYIGSYSVKIMDNEGDVHLMKKSKIRFRLYGPPKDSKRESSSVDAILVPIGGRPDYKKR